MHNMTTCNNVIHTPALVRFFAITFLLGIATQLVALHLGLHGPGSAFLLLTMWTPAIAALSASRETRALAIAALKKLRWRWLGLGLLVGLAPGILKALLLALSGAGHWDRAHFELALGGHSIKGIHHLAVVLGSGPQSFPYFALNLFLSLTLGSVILAFLGGVGEELGWRVILQPALEQRCGRLLGTCFVGLIWAYWHLPVNLSGYNDPKHPIWTALLFFPLGLIGLSFSLAWLTTRSRSVWPAALAHGANNTIGSAFLIVTPVWSANTAAELLSLLLVGGFCAWLFLTHPSATRPGSLATPAPKAF